jgi:hypothetical protein
MAGIEMPLKACAPRSQRCEPDRAGQPSAGRLAPDGVDHRGDRHGRRGDLDAGGLPLPAHGPAPDGKIIGHFTACGVRSHYAERFRQWGYDLPAAIYEPVAAE